jgi:hypothetical protein
MSTAAVRATIIVLAASLGSLPSVRSEASLGETPSLQEVTSSADQGRRSFARVWSWDDGLGPQFNARSCHSCHVSPIPGGAGTDRITMVQLSARALDPAGGHVVRKFWMGPEGRIGSRTPPADGVLRKPPSLFGLGDLEQVPEHVLLEYADPDDRDGDGISGRLARVNSGVGRFGWKARFATIEDAVAAALVNELGLTTSRYPKDGGNDDRKKPEVDDATWHAVAASVVQQHGRYIRTPISSSTRWAPRSPTGLPRAMPRGRSSARRRSGGLPARGRPICTMDGHARSMTPSSRTTGKARAPRQPTSTCR